MFRRESRWAARLISVVVLTNAGWTVVLAQPLSGAKRKDAANQTAAGQSAEPTAGQSPPAAATPPAGSKTPPADSAAPLGKAPWAKSRDVAGPPPSEQLESPRKLFELFGIGKSQFDAFFDGAALGDENDESLARILFRLPQIGLDDVQRWRREGADWETVIASPAEYRGEFFHLQGTVTRVTPHILIPELAAAFEFDKYYRVELTPAEGPTAIICTRAIPQAWPLDAALHERASASGLFLKVGATVNGNPQLVFAARRVAWRPDAGSRIPNLPPGHLLLSNRGVDIGLFDEVRARNRQKIGSQDRECFYQMLAAAKQTTRGELGGQIKSASLATLLTAPEQEHGELMRLIGNAQRITRIRVNAADIKSRFGLDHYYQIDLFIPLGDQTVQLARKKGDTDGPIYTNEFPAVACVPSLPPDLSKLARELAESDSQTQLLNERIELTGFFFKLWTYRSEYVAGYGKDQRQLAPMFIAVEPEMRPLNLGAAPTSAVYVAVFFLTALGLVWWSVWRNSRKAAQFERDADERRFGLKPGKSLDSLDPPNRDKPDFTGLE